MPRDGSNIYSAPAGTTATPGTTIESAKYNSLVNDLVADANLPRPIVAGGTGASTAGAALTALGAQPADADLTAIAAIASNGLVARTGAGTAAARTITGTAGLITVTNGDGVSGNPTATIANGTTGQLLRSGASAPAWEAQITLATSVASTSGTSIDFTGIPSWARRVTVMLDGVSTNGATDLLFQLGSGSIQTTGYNAASSFIAAGSTAFASYTTGFGSRDGNAATVRYGSFVFERRTGNVWMCRGLIAAPGSLTAHAAGSVSLSGALDRVRVTSASGADTFDAGAIGLSYE